MGSIASITHIKFPRQSFNVGRHVNVCFHYDTDNIILGIVIRDDTEEPHRTVFLLEDGRVVLATECHYNFPSDQHAKPDFAFRLSKIVDEESING